MFDRFLDTPKGFTTISKHFKHCLNTSKVDMGIIFLIKNYIINYLKNYSFPISTTFESIKHVNFSGYLLND